MLVILCIDQPYRLYKYVNDKILFVWLLWYSKCWLLNMMFNTCEHGKSDNNSLIKRYGGAERNGGKKTHRKTKLVGMVRKS